MSQLYKDKKQKFDDMVYGYLVKRLTEPYKDTDAFGMKHIDEHGNELNDTSDWSYTRLDKLVFDLRAALGENLGKFVPESADGVDPLALMLGTVDRTEYMKKYSGVVKLVEECSYLPESVRGESDGSLQDSDLTMGERISFALTVATALMTSMLKDRLITDAEFDNDVLEKTESTFGIRSIGDSAEVIGFLRGNGLTNGREITNAGLRLAYRLAVEIVKNRLVEVSKDTNNQAINWVEVSRA